jgi:Flp pilus assembly protein TadD
MVLGALAVVAGVLTSLMIGVARWPRDDAADAGAKLMARGDYQAAMPLLLRAVTIRADDPWAHYRLGLAYARIGWHGAAIHRLTAAAQLGPQSAEFREALGCAYRDAGKTAAAVKELEEAARLAPEEARHHVRLAGLLLEVGRRAEAIEYLRKAAELRPASPAIRALLARVFSEPAEPEVARQDREHWRRAAEAALGELARQELRARPASRTERDACTRPAEAAPAPLSR